MPLSVFIIIFIDFILCRFLEIFTNSKTYTIDAFPRYCWTYMTLRGCFLRQAQQFWKTNPLCTHFMSIARLQSYSSRSKIRNFGFLEFLPQTDHRHRLFLCRENRFGSSMFTYLRILAIFALTWTKSGNIAPILLLGGLRVPITANRKGWYIWLLEFPSLINLKHKMAVFMKGLFRFTAFFTYLFAQLSNVDNFQTSEARRSYILGLGWITLKQNKKKM